MMSENGKALIAWLNVCVIWGTTYLVIRIGVGHMPPMLFAGIRWVIAGIVFIAALTGVALLYASRKGDLYWLRSFRGKGDASQ